MTRDAFIVVLFLTLGVLRAAEAPFAEVPRSIAPSGLLAARTEPPNEALDGRDSICFYRPKSGEVFARIPLGGYASYPLDADPMNLTLLWSPNSRHLAITVRGSKRSWTMTIYAFRAKGLRALDLPSATAKALRLLSGSENFRVSHETPTKWIDDDRLLLRASGDTTIQKKVIWYEVDLTYSISKRVITRAKIIGTQPREG